MKTQVISLAAVAVFFSFTYSAFSAGMESGTVIGHMQWKPNTNIARFLDADGKTVLKLNFDADKVFRAVFSLADGKTVHIQRRPAFGDDVSTDTMHFALVWGGGNPPRLFLNSMPFHSSAGIMRGDYPRIDISGNLLSTVASSNIAAFAKLYPRPLSNAEVMDDFRRYMPIDLVARDVDHTASPDMRFAFTVGPDGSFLRPYPAPDRKPAASARVSFTAEVVGHPETLTKFDDVLVDKPTDLALNDSVAALPPGPYRVVFKFSTGFAYTIRYNVMSPAPKLPEPSLEPFSRVRTIDEVAFSSPAAAPFTNCVLHMAETSAGKYLEADAKSGDRFAWIFRVPKELLGKACVIDFEWPDDRERVMGLYAYVSGKGMTCRDRISNGVIAGGIFPNSGKAKTHSVMFWPASTNVLFEARTLVAGRPAALLSAKLSQLAEPLPVLAVRRPSWTKGRTFGHCDEDQVFDVYIKRDIRGNDTEGTLRDLVAYLKYTGQDLFQYGCGFRYRYGMDARFLYREDCEHHWPVNAGEYPWVTRELSKAGIAYSGIVWGGCLPEAENDDLLGWNGERRGWYLKNDKGERRPKLEVLNIANAELVDMFYSYFTGLFADCARDGLSAVRFDLNSGSVNTMDHFASQLSFGAWEGSMWGGRTEEERIDAVTRNVRRFREIMSARAPSLETRFGILVTPTMRLDALKRECGIDLDRIAAIDGAKFALRRQFTQYWFDLFRGKDETDGQEFYYDAAAPEWTAFRKASGGAVAQVAAHNVYIETFEKSPKNDEFPSYFQNSDVKPNGRYFLKEPAFCVGTMDALNFALGDQPLGSSGNEEEVREFVRAYEALPALPFADLAGDSPAVVGRSLSTDHGTYFYFVNMHHAPQRAELSAAVEAEDLSTGAKSVVKSVALKGFELRSFLAPKGTEVGKFRVVRLPASTADDAARLKALLEARARLSSAGIDDAEGDAMLRRAGYALARYNLPEAHRQLHSVRANYIASQVAAIAEVTEEAELHRRGIWRINCGNTAYSRIDGDLFSPDRQWDDRTHGWYGGQGLAIARDASGIKAGEKYAALYATEKYRIDGYRVNVGAPGRYRVRVFAKAGWPRTFESGAWLTDYTFGGKPLFPRVDFLRDQPDYWTPAKHEAVVEVGADGLIDIGISSPSDPTIAFINGLEIERLR